MKIKKIGRACRQAGFTLFELLVSISIIGILTAIATLSYTSVQKKARDSRRVSDMDSIQKAAEQYYSVANYTYPTTSGIGESWVVNGQTVLQNFPGDPKGVGWTAYYPSMGVGGSYCICAAMENPLGNSLTNGCSFAGVGGTGPWYCVKSQQ